MPRPAPRNRIRGKSHNRLLLLIAVYKLLYALFFIGIGVGAHRLLHKNLADEVEIFARHLRFNPESRLVSFVLEKASLVNGPVLRRISLFAYCYAAVTLTEGIGLYLEKAWGEFLTLAITASFLPWELIEIFRHVSWIRIGLLAINVVVFVYLLRLILDRARRGVKTFRT